MYNCHLLECRKAGEMNSHLSTRIYAAITLLLLASFSARLWADVPFDHVIVDREGPKDPWAKILGDIDGDGFTDIVIGAIGLRPS
jgi:hypothetical protein